MPNSINAAKRHRQSLVARQRNREARSRIRTQVKKFELALKSEEIELAKSLFADFVKYVDTAVGKKLYHRNNAARKKSRLYSRLQLSVK